MDHPSSNKLLFSIADSIYLLGVGRSTVYREIAAGRLRTCKLGSRTLIRKADLDDYCASLAMAEGVSSATVDK